MRQGKSVTSYRERLIAPPSWWLFAVAFGVVWGWIVLVIASVPAAVATGVIVAAGSALAVLRYGSLTIEVTDDVLRAGRATVERRHLGRVEPLARPAYRHRLGAGADVRGLLVTRPYLDRGVLVEIADTSDPTPYWLLSSRRPEALAAALGHTGDAPDTPAHDTNGETPRGEEA
jgi:hypothetical protein